MAFLQNPQSGDDNRLEGVEVLVATNKKRQAKSGVILKVQDSLALDVSSVPVWVIGGSPSCQSVKSSSRFNHFECKVCKPTSWSTSLAMT